MVPTAERNDFGVGCEIKPNLGLPKEPGNPVAGNAADEGGHDFALDTPDGAPTAVLVSGPSTKHLTLVNKLRNDYTEAINVVDNEVGKLIQQGREMRSLQLLNESLAKIIEIHETLAAFYALVFNNTETLRRFRLQHLNNSGTSRYPSGLSLKMPVLAIRKWKRSS